MAFTGSDGMRIRYEVLGSGPPLFLHIGYTLGLEDWGEEGYIAALQDRYRLILIDPRGQGQSDAPHAPGAYTLEQRVGDVLAVLDATGVARAHFWGYSMGGRIGYALGINAPERLRTLVIGGERPFSGNPRPIRQSVPGDAAGRDADYEGLPGGARRVRMGAPSETSPHASLSARLRSGSSSWLCGRWTRSEPPPTRRGRRAAPEL